MKILLVEDDEFIAQSLEDILRDETPPILRGIVLPKLNGIEFCQKLRSVGN